MIINVKYLSFNSNILNYITFLTKLTSVDMGTQKKVRNRLIFESKNLMVVFVLPIHTGSVCDEVNMGIYQACLKNHSTQKTTIPTSLKEMFETHKQRLLQPSNGFWKYNLPIPPFTS